jgi:4-amino-4-deoxy-L-arabinose transferase-like glycosyltransferase
VSLNGVKFQILLSKVLQILCMLFFIFTFWNGISFFKQTYGMNLKNILFFILIIFMMLTAVFFINRIFTNKQYFIFLFVFAFTLRFIWIINVNTPITSDFALMYNGAKNAAQGVFIFNESSYFSTWVFQLGFTMYEAFIIRIFGENPFILKLLNALFSTGTTIILYKITAKIFNDVSGRIAGFLYAIFIPSIVMSSVLTNQHLATFLFYLGFYFIINHRYSKKFMWMYMGIFLSLGDVVRPLGNLILLAVGLFFFIDQFIGKEKEIKKNTLKTFSGIIISFFLVHLIISQLFISMEITKYPLSNRDPLWKFVIGLNQKTTGGYSIEDSNFLNTFKNANDRKNAEIQLIKARTANKQKLMILFRDKLKTMWATNDLSIFWSMGYLDQKQLINKLYKLERLIYISMMFFGVTAFVMNYFNNKLPTNLSLFLLLIIGYVAVHLLIEIQTRYRYFIIPSFFIIESYGVYSFYTFFFGHRLSNKYNLLNKVSNPDS